MKRKNLCNFDDNKKVKRKRIFATVTSLAFAGLFAVVAIVAPFTAEPASAASAYIGDIPFNAPNGNGVFKRMNSAFRCDFQFMTVADSYVLSSGSLVCPDSFGFVNGIDKNDGYDTVGSASFVQGANHSFAFNDDVLYENLDCNTKVLISPPSAGYESEVMSFSWSLEANNMAVNYLFYEIYLLNNDAHFRLISDVAYGKYYFGYDFYCTLKFRKDGTIHSGDAIGRFDNSFHVNDRVWEMPLEYLLPSVQELKDLGALLNDNSFFFTEITIGMEYRFSRESFTNSIGAYPDSLSFQFWLYGDEYAHFTPIDYLEWWRYELDIYDYLRGYYMRPTIEYGGDVARPLWYTIEEFLALEILPDIKVSYLILIFCSFVLFSLFLRFFK